MFYLRGLGVVFLAFFTKKERNDSFGGGLWKVRDIRIPLYPPFSFFFLARAMNLLDSFDPTKLDASFLPSGRWERCWQLVFMDRRYISNQEQNFHEFLVTIFVVPK